MATINAYGGRFIGNDFVVQRTRPQSQPQPRSRIEPAQRQRFATTSRQVPVARTQAQSQVQTRAQPQYFEQPVEAYEQPEESVELFSAQMPEERQAHAFSMKRLLSRRAILIASGAVVALGLLAVAIPRSGEITSVASTESSKLTAVVLNAIHPTSQSNFTMPPHSLLMKNDVLSSYVDSVEGQEITINIGTISVTPLPTDIANWIKTSNGPEANTTLLSVNTASISQYVTNAMQNTPKQPGDLTSVNTSAETTAVNQIAQSLLKYKGMTVTIPSQS
jgi:hypothetical protein